MNELTFKKIRLVLCLTLSIFVLFTFITYFFNRFNSSIIIYFIIFQFLTWSPVFFKKKMIILTNSLFFLILINLLSTPFNYSLTKDLPYNIPNSEYNKDYTNSDYFKNIFYGKHRISFDEMGYRTNNKKIDYTKKKDNILRIFTIGGSTTIQIPLDDSKTWSSLTGTKIQKNYNKEVEVINTGLLGFKSSHHYLTLKRIEKYNPDIVVFLVGINDWNDHIVLNKIEFLFPYYQLNYDVKNSILYRGLKNIEKQFVKKTSHLFNFQKKSSPYYQPTADIVEEKFWFENRTHLINAESEGKKIKRFKTKTVSQRYNFWMSKIINECNKKSYTCIFMDQPTAYKDNISEDLKSRLWMTPPYVDYTLPFEDLMDISIVYNNWLKKNISENNLNFVELSTKIPPTLDHFFDECHFTEKGSQVVSNILFNHIRDNLDLNKL